MRNSKTTLLAAGFAALLSANAAAVPFPQGKVCAAWKTKKTMFLFRKLEPVGMNCSSRATVESAGAGKRLKVSVPISAFDSGEPSRDKEVVKILKAEVQPELEFLSRSYTPDEWKAFGRSQGLVLEGSLKIGGKEFPVSAPFSIVGEGADAAAVGSFVTSFSAFSITPPAVAGGLVAQVQDYLELHYRVPLSLISGR